MKGTKSLAKGTDTEMARGGKGPRPKVNNAWPKSHFIQGSYQRGRVGNFHFAPWPSKMKIPARWEAEKIGDWIIFSEREIEKTRENGFKRVSIDLEINNSNSNQLPLEWKKL